MYVDLEKPRPIRVKNIIGNAFLYCIGLLYSGVSSLIYRGLLEDDAPLAQLLDQAETPTILTEVLWYMFITTTFIWACFNTICQARQLKHISNIWLFIIFMMSTLNNGVLFSLIPMTSIGLEEWSLLWYQPLMVKFFAFQSYSIYWILFGLSLSVSIRTAMLLFNKLLQKIRKIHF